MTPKVWNKRDPGVPGDAVYVGRPTKWGNPYSHKDGTKARWKVATRDAAVDAYVQYLHETLEGRYLQHAALEELRGKDLVCWCAPERCHADVLIEIANAD